MERDRQSSTCGACLNCLRSEVLIRHASPAEQVVCLISKAFKPRQVRSQILFRTLLIQFTAKPARCHATRCTRSRATRDAQPLPQTSRELSRFESRVALRKIARWRITLHCPSAWQEKAPRVKCCWRALLAGPFLGAGEGARPARGRGEGTRGAGGRPEETERGDGGRLWAEDGRAGELAFWLTGQ